MSSTGCPPAEVLAEYRERFYLRARGPARQGFVYTSTKRLFDIAFSFLGLMLAWPLMVLAAIWVRLDSEGPILYRQTRVGKDGAEFQMLKFRTMSDSAESLSGPVWAKIGDERITRAGAILRRLYIDELPQLINILRGDMSFVGPRPERPFFYPKCEEAIPGFCARCVVQPGLTGLAQVRQNHDGSLRAMRRKFRYDLLYIRKQTFLLDLWIMVRTTWLLWREFKEIWG